MFFIWRKKSERLNLALDIRKILQSAANELACKMNEVQIVSWSKENALAGIPG
jgi:hypothetical protein